MTSVLERDPGTRARRGRVRRFRRRFSVLVVAAALALGAGVGAQQIVSRDGGGDQVVDGPFRGEQVTTLVVLTLAGDPSQQADALTLFGFAPDGSDPAAMFIPIDTIAEVPGGGSMAIGKAMTFGRLSLVELSVENLLGLQIDRVLGIDDVTLAQVIDALGGIEVNVEEELREPDELGRLQLVFPMGAQRMDGARAVTYLTYRPEGSTDLDRFPRAQRVWEAILRAGSPEDIAAAVMRFEESVTGFEGAALLAETLRVLASGPRVTFEVMPPSPVGSGGPEEVYRVDEAALAEVIRRSFSGSLPEPDVGVGARVELRNGNGVPEVGERVAALLIPAGMRIVLSGNARSFDFPSTRVVVYGDDEDALALGRRIVDLLGVGEVEIGTRGQTVADVTVVVGRDFVER